MNSLSFSGSSVGKESSCNAGHPGLTHGLGRSAVEGIDYPLQYSWGSLVVQVVKNLMAMWGPGFDPWVGKIPWRRERLPIPVLLGFPCVSAGKESTCNAGALGSISELGRSLEEERLPSPVFWPRDFHGLFSLWGCKESDMTEWLPLSLSLWTFQVTEW